jgi:hypothetical protein
MDGRAFDDMSRAMARGMPRRQLLARLGAGGLGAGLLAAIGVERTRSARPAAQDDTCRLTLVANVRLGPSAGAVLAGTTPGELRGELSFALGDGGAIESGRLRLADDTEFPVVGQAIGRAVHLRVQLAERQPVVLVGTAAEDLGACRGAVDGLLTGPQAGDLGDWHATATALRRQSGGSSGSGGTRSGAQATARPAATAAPTGEATSEATSVPCVDEDHEVCDGRCTNLMVDPTNCGACGNVCAEGQVCEGGACIDGGQGGCDEGLTDCDGTCVDLGSDHANCGGCGQACGAFQACQGGTCTDVGGGAGSCQAGQTLCNGACVDLGSDPNNCGACGNACPADQNCVAGTCVPLTTGPGAASPCRAGLTECGGTCVDLGSDPAHCGACGNACPAGDFCSPQGCYLP